MKAIILLLFLCSCSIKIIEPLENKTIEVQVLDLNQNIEIFKLPLYSKLSILLEKIACDECDMTRFNPEMLLKHKDIIVLYPIIDRRVSINQATSIELQELPGIGPSIAEKIINYRNAYGLFQKLEDIMRIKGIKNALFNKIKELIRL